MRHIIPISGKDSLATAIIQKELQPELEYEYIFNPTGKELPETIEWLKKVEIYLGKPILFIGVDMKTTSEWISGFRPTQWARWCTRKCKIEPTEEYFKGEGFIYYGLRYDEPERIGYVTKGKSELQPKYPLRDIKYGIEDVLKLCNEKKLKPPTFYWSLFEEEFTKRLGVLFINEKLTEWQRDQLFAWRTRNNCYDCFNMKQYEWVGFEYHHPEIFWEIVKEEETIDTRQKPFFIIKDTPLRSLITDKIKILSKHITKTTNLLLKLNQTKLFTVDDIFTDILSTTSCGLLCGK